MFPLMRLILAVLAFLSLIDSIRGKPLRFEDNREAWFTSMEQNFVDLRVLPAWQTTYAIQEGLKLSPELQTAMSDRFDQYARLIAQIAPKDAFRVDLEAALGWPWEEFKRDISRVSDAAKQIDGFSAYETAGNSAYGVQDQSNSPEHRGIHFPHIQLPHIELPPLKGILRGMREVLEQPHIELPPLEEILRTIREAVEQPIELPPLEEILRGIRKALEQAKTQLDLVIQDKFSQAEEFLKNIEHFVSIQIQLLPEGVRNAIQEFNTFRHEHPYIIAAASVALVIVSTEVILPWMFLRVLGLFGFGELGPVAGSWAAAIQSVWYGGRTSGIFSILQSIAMTAKLFWPAKVFLDLVAIGTGTVIVWSSELVKETVDTWYSDMVIPDLNLVVQNDAVAGVMLNDFMRDLGRRCGEAGIPEVQWLDVAIQAITKAVQEMAEVSGV